MTARQWRSAALAALWTLVAASFGLMLFNAWRLQPVEGPEWLLVVRGLLVFLVTLWWTQVFTRYSAGQETSLRSGVLLALKGVYPWLTALRVSLWTLNLLAVGQLYPEAHPVAVTALLTIEVGFILAKNAQYGTLARWAVTPELLLGRVRLVQWLNVAAALSLAIGLVNITPVVGMGEPEALTTRLVLGAHAALDVLATLLALKAVQVMEGSEPSPGVSDR